MEKSIFRFQKPKQNHQVIIGILLSKVKSSLDLCALSKFRYVYKVMWFCTWSKFCLIDQAVLHAAMFTVHFVRTRSVQPDCIRHPGMLKSTYLLFSVKTTFQVQSAINVALF